LFGSISLARIFVLTFWITFMRLIKGSNSSGSADSETSLRLTTRGNTL
jgi:hypothetical protein